MKNPHWMAILFSIFCLSKTYSAPQSTPTSPWVLDQGEKGFIYASGVPLVGTVKLRAGYFRESIDKAVPFKGCVLYLEGLGDSILNHAPYFTVLSQAGYRVITFDYLGQGGSEGSMNHTRIIDSSFPALQIANIAEQVWEKYSMIKDNLTGHDCGRAKKIVIGWSTGGLAAYDMANRHWADAIIMIAPGIAPNTYVGESATNHKLLLMGSPVISQRTLTRNTFSNGNNPHLDPIKPQTPVKVPLFAANLVLTAKSSQDWVIEPSVKGLLFASGVEDTYVDTQSIILKIKENAKHFDIVEFPGALHELDNELPSVTSHLQMKTLQFLANLQ